MKSKPITSDANMANMTIKHIAVFAYRNAMK